MVIATSARRVESNSSPSANQRIYKYTRDRIAEIAWKPDAIRARLVELDREWDIERYLETGSASLTLTGLALGLFIDKRWLALSAAVQGFFLQHAIQGWCPPLPVLRALGVRTVKEIEAERHALKALLGEYERSPTSTEANIGNRHVLALQLFDRAMA